MQTGVDVVHLQGDLRVPDIKRIGPYTGTSPEICAISVPLIRELPDYRRFFGRFGMPKRCYE